jgi:hypothetical protein
MDVKTFSDQLQIRMNEQIEVVREEESDELKATAKNIQVIRESLLELKQFIHQYEFKNQEEEIRFFKEIKPGFLSKYFYCDQLLSILIGESFTDLHDKKKYYRKALKQIRKFQKRNNDFYQYWITDGDYLDDKFFTRKKALPNDPNLDDKFSTLYDIKLGQLMAYRELKNDLNSKIKNGHHEPKLQWTGSKAALVELIYALQTVGVFNNATTDVKQIATCFEELFDVNLGNFYDTFQEIKIRKRIQTRFLDLMKEKLLLRIETFD